MAIGIQCFNKRKFVVILISSILLYTARLYKFDIKERILYNHQKTTPALFNLALLSNVTNSSSVSGSIKTGVYVRRDTFEDIRKRLPEARASRHVFPYRILKIRNETDEMAEQENKWKEVEARQVWRRDVVRSKCNELGLLKPASSLTQDQLNYLEFYAVDNVHNVILKSIPKTGCTSWYSLLINNSPTMIIKNSTYFGIKPYNQFHWHLYPNYGLQMLNRYRMEDQMSKLNTYFTVLTVRHPFVRLESYFKDKILKFERLQRIDVRYSDAIQSRFQSFMNCILVEHKENRHWRTMYNSSFPCQIDYKYIAKTETTQSDMAYIHQMKLSAVGDLEHKNPTNQLDYKEENARVDGGYYLPYFSTLSDPEGVIGQFMHIYHADMQIFGYELVEEQGQYYATCTNFKTFGSCW